MSDRASDPLIVHVSAPEQLQSLVQQVPQSAKDLIDRFWPGPLSVVLPKQSCVPGIVTAGLPNVAGDRLPMVLDGGPCKVGVECCVVSFVDNSPVILRPGGVTPEEIEELIGPLQSERYLRAIVSLLSEPGCEHVRTPAQHVWDAYLERFLQTLQNGVSTGAYPGHLPIQGQCGWLTFA